MSSETIIRFENVSFEYGVNKPILSLRWIFLFVVEQRLLSWARMVPVKAPSSALLLVQTKPEDGDILYRQEIIRLPSLDRLSHVIRARHSLSENSLKNASLKKSTISTLELMKYLRLFTYVDMKKSMTGSWGHFQADSKLDSYS
jgi:hypothetical protein